MGVPKFYHFLSNRYPCINKIVKEHEIPNYDNLYLDMNSIVHICSHPGDSDIHFRIGKKEFSDIDIFENVSRYVDILYHIIKPKEVMFLAFDGVTPRAKINQQRGQRFRTVKSLDGNIFSENVHNIYKEEVFDANCITPGTSFMNDLTDYMKHFIAYKISTNSLWKKCKIILSGSEVPGEGEHKIMEFIRINKAQPYYNQNTKHCLYSFDSDLIILGLSTHEPHFSLLHEKVPFGKKRNMITPEESNLVLLQLSLLREYLDHEFTPVKLKLNFDYDLEKIIDDWILIGFLVGNDFIPQLPGFYILDGALPYIYSTYINVLPTLDGYINNGGQLDLMRFEIFVKSLSKIDVESVESLKHFKLKRDNYYKTKLKFTNINKSTIQILVERYIKTIQWNLNYYYNGCSSWSWYYPYHYAPLISDIKDIQNIDLKFDIGKPFLPLQHLLAVLPPKSNQLLPKPLRYLVTNENSPIIDFYPENFEMDQNGKLNDWESVVLIPFIDEMKLIKAMEPYNTLLDIKERKRNTNGFFCKFTYNKIHSGHYPIDTIFGPFVNYSKLDYAKPEDIIISKEKLVKNLCQNIQLSIRQGFPTLKHIQHSFELKIREVNMNYLASKYQTMILNVTPKPQIILDKLAEELLGQTVYINWPHIQEAYVIGVTDYNTKIMLSNFWQKYDKSNIKYSNLSESTKITLDKENELITENYWTQSGINIGKTEFFVIVFPLMGKRYICENHGKVILQSKWSNVSKEFPYQLIINDAELYANKPKLYKSPKEFFRSTNCFIIGQPHYGSMAEVTAVVTKQNPKEPMSVAINLEVIKDPEFDLSTYDFFSDTIDYLPSIVVAKKLNIHVTTLNRITGNLVLIEESIDSEELTTNYKIGLGIKLSKYNKELYGYTKKIKNVWHYSPKAIELIQSYVNNFPEVFANLNNTLKQSVRIVRVFDIFPHGLEDYKRIKAWIEEQQRNYSIFLECNTKSLGYNALPKLENIVSQFFENESKQIITVQIQPQNLFIPGSITGTVPIDIKAQHNLLDRIICCRDNFTVPLGLRGTIIGIQTKDEPWNNVYEILFDKPFRGGLTLYESSSHRCYRLKVTDFINVSYGKRIDQSSNLNFNRKWNNNAQKHRSETNSVSKSSKPVINRSTKINNRKPLHRDNSHKK